MKEEKQILDQEEELNEEGQISNPFIEITEKSTKIQEYKVYSRRWVILICFTMALAASSLIMAGFGSIAYQLTIVYNCSDNEVLLSMLCFMIAYIVMTIPLIIMIEKLGIVFCLVMGSAIQISSNWLRLLVAIDNQFWYVVIFTFPVAFMQPFYVNMVSKLVNNWFPNQERALTTALGYSGFTIGLLIGSFLPNFFMFHALDKPVEEAQKDFNLYLFVQNVIVTVLCIPILFVIKEHPPTPPSAMNLIKKDKLNLWRDIKLLAKNKDFIGTIFAFASLKGMYNCLGTCISFLTIPYGYTSADCTIMGVCLVLSGIPSCYIIAAYLDKNRHQYRNAQIILTIGSVLSIPLCYWTLPSGNVPVLGASVAFIGLFVLPCGTVTFPYSIMQTYPIPEVAVNGYMCFASEIFGTLLGFLVTDLCRISPLAALPAFNVTALIGAFFAIFLKSKNPPIDYPTTFKDKQQLIKGKHLSEETFNPKIGTEDTPSTAQDVQFK